VKPVIFSAAAAALALAFAAPPAIGAGALGPIHVVAATYGGRNDLAPKDFTAALQSACGEASTYCEAFCSQAFVGLPRARYGHAYCRVIFRCGEQTTQVAEAGRNETLTLNCRAQQ
jgi:hypothetical protein